MKNHIQASLVIISIMFLIWGMGFIMFPETVHMTLSAGTYDPATAILFAATLIGMSLLCLIVAQDPQRDMVYGMASALGFLGIASAIGMLPGGGILHNAGTVVSLIVTVGVSVYLFVIQSEAFAAGSSGSSSRKAKKKPAKKAKKKVAKKAPAKKAKKKAKKRR